MISLTLMAAAWAFEPAFGWPDWQHLAEAGIYVRRFDGLPGKLRIGLPADEIQLARLNEALSLLG